MAQGDNNISDASDKNKTPNNGYKPTRRGVLKKIGSVSILGIIGSAGANVASAASAASVADLVVSGFAGKSTTYTIHVTGGIWKTGRADPGDDDRGSSIAGTINSGGVDSYSYQGYINNVTIRGAATFERSGGRDGDQLSPEGFIRISSTGTAGADQYELNVEGNLYEENDTLELESGDDYLNRQLPAFASGTVDNGSYYFQLNSGLNYLEENTTGSTIEFN